MSRALTPQDCYGLVNAIYAQLTGQVTLAATDTSSFVSVGESILAAGTENTLNALSLVLGRTFIATRPYNAKLDLFNVTNSGLYANRMRKISYLSHFAQPSGAFNTNLYTNHAQGFDNGSNPNSATPPVPQSLPTMWEQNQPTPIELNFGGSSVWDDSITIYEDQLQAAFRDENEFAKFMSGVMVEKGNDIESQKEAFSRALLLNYLAGLYDVDSDLGSVGMSTDLAATYNAKFGTNHSRNTLLTTEYTKFLEFVIASIKQASDLMTHRAAAMHWAIDDGNGHTLLRHTPKDRQKLIMYKPFWIDAEARVLPEIFNDQYLKPGNYEGVDYWQAWGVSLPNYGPAIDITPAIPDVSSSPIVQTAGTQVQLDYVLGVLYDEDALMIDYQLDAAYSTPVEARKRYRNIWWHFKKNAINDFTENGVLFYIGDGGDDT